MDIRRPAIRGGLALLAATTLGACASSGGPEPAPVPVFFSEDEVPCAFERTGPVSDEALPERNW